MRATVDQAIDLIERIDWQRVFTNLRAVGVPVSRVAVEAGMAWQTGERYAAGAVRRPPAMLQALRLLDLHIERCPERHSMEVLSRAV